ncbi:MAG: IS110 family transposase [Aestuariivirga sp.]|uniref:IS110 family transposase n=1 Tax=Aestuariivirga sp. TaxID=2650926 RepID=UPI0025C4FD73|nr:IS110 family transposase [Aestuariivirga sp.]MCA3560619.1 IS110 family transposase [Aestuariivirga sp.]
MQGQEATEVSSGQKSNIGIDVSKHWLDVHVLPSLQVFRVPNDAQGHRRLKRHIAGLEIACVALEPTGKWHRALCRSLIAAGLPVMVTDPARVRMFAKITGLLAKTDRLDAAVLAAFAATMGAAARPLPSEAIDAIAELITARDGAVAELVRLKNQQHAACDRFLKRQLLKRIRAAEKVIENLDAEIQRRIKADPALAARQAILCSIPGIGEVTAALAIAKLPELGSLSDKEIAMLAGLAPIADQSGKRDGQRRVQGGRPCLARGFYIASLSAVRCNPTLKAFYRRLRLAKKPPKCALIAVARKLLLLANTLIAQNRMWLPTAPKPA